MSKPQNVELVTVPGETFTVVHLSNAQLHEPQIFLMISKWMMEYMAHVHPHTDRDIFSMTRTPDELSVVCRASVIPAGIRSSSAKMSANFRAFKVKGPLDLSLVGILSHLTTVLANAHIPVFALCSYETDYLFVKQDTFGAAYEALKKSGHKITDGVEPKPNPSMPFMDPFAQLYWTCLECAKSSGGATRNPHTLVACSTCNTARPATAKGGVDVTKYSEFHKTDVDKPAPVKPDYVKLPADAIDMNTGKVNPAALKEATERAAKRKEKGSLTKPANYLALDNRYVEPAARHQRSHSTGAPPSAVANYSTMPTNMMAGVSIDPATKKPYLDLERNDFKLHAAKDSQGGGGSGHTVGHRRTDSGSAGDEGFDMPSFHPSSNYASSMALADFPESGGQQPIQRQHATIGGMMSVAGSGTGSGGVDGGLSTSSLQRSESGDSGGSYSTVSTLDVAGAEKKWSAAEGRLDLDMERKPYFKGDIGRQGAQRALEAKPAGTFLFRLCTDKNENDMANNVFVLNYVNAADKKFSNVKIYRFTDEKKQRGWCMHKDRSGTVYPNLDIIIKAINFGVSPKPLE